MILPKTGDLVSVDIEKINILYFTKGAPVGAASIPLIYGRPQSTCNILKEHIFNTIDEVSRLAKAGHPLLFVKFYNTNKKWFWPIIMFSNKVGPLTKMNFMGGNFVLLKDSNPLPEPGNMVIYSAGRFFMLEPKSEELDTPYWKVVSTNARRRN